MERLAVDHHRVEHRRIDSGRQRVVLVAYVAYVAYVAFDLTQVNVVTLVNVRAAFWVGMRHE